MSKYSEEFEGQYPTVGKLKKATKVFKKMTEEDKSKYWIHKEKNWGCEVDLKYYGKKKKIQKRNI